jgi:hypothetical protein
LGLLAQEKNLFLKNILSGKLFTFKLIFVLTNHNIEELFKNSVGEIGAKILLIFFTFLTPFSG